MRPLNVILTQLNQVGQVSNVNLQVKTPKTFGQKLPYFPFSEG